MAGLGIGIAWFGYWVLYYGATQVQGGNWGFLDLGIPSRWAAAAATPTDSGTKLTTATPSPVSTIIKGDTAIVKVAADPAPVASGVGNIIKILTGLP